MKRSFAFILAMLCVLALCPAHGEEDAAARLEAARGYLSGLVPAPEYGAEWVVWALAASGGVPEEYADAYCNSLASVPPESLSKSTDAARVVLALTALGRDAADCGGYDYTSPLLDVEFATRQGLNGACYALLALDAGAYPADVRAEYVGFILSRQLADGGWALRGEVGDTDMTAIAVQALLPYREDEAVSAAIESGLARLEALRREDGGYASFGTECSESAAQAIIAFCLAGEKARCGETLPALLAYSLPSGAFAHVADGGENTMATCQAVLALTHYLNPEEDT